MLYRSKKMKKASWIVLTMSALLVAGLVASCTSSSAFVRVNSGEGGFASTASGLSVTVAGWDGGVITVADALEDDAAAAGFPEGRVVAGRGFFWVPGGTTASETIFKFPVSGYADGAELDLYWFDVASLSWIPFGGWQAVVDGNLAVVTFPDGASALGGNFAVVD